MLIIYLKTTDKSTEPNQTSDWILFAESDDCYKLYISYLLENQIEVVSELFYVNVEPSDVDVQLDDETGIYTVKIS